MIKNKFLTPPVKVDIPVTSYDFSELTDSGKMYTVAEVEELIKKQKRLTPLIIKNIIDITENYDRQGVMIFSSTVSHASEICTHLPEGDYRVVLGDTEVSERDKIIDQFKQKKFKYLVNVSVLTTGFDAPHVDVIAILRPTESVSLYQQIIGRGLRLADGKQDCFVLDYAGMGHDIYSPEISDKKPTKESVPVLVTCPSCGHENYFWGYTNIDGEVIEHFGRKCRGAEFDQDTLEVIPCGYLFRFKTCHNCGEQNDVSAKKCSNCKIELVDPDTKLKQARLSKNAHVLKPDSVEYIDRKDKTGNQLLEVRYYDFDGKYLAEYHYLNNGTSRKKFNINFLRSHMRKPELGLEVSKVEEVIYYQKLLEYRPLLSLESRINFGGLRKKFLLMTLLSNK